MTRFIHSQLQNPPQEKPTVMLWERWLDGVSLCAVLHYLVFRFFQQSTMFPFVYTELYKTATLLSLAAAGGMRFLFAFIKAFKSCSSPATTGRYLLKCVAAGCLALLFFYVGLRNDYKNLVFLPLTALCLYNMHYKKVLRCFVWLIGMLVSATVICCLAGAVKNIALWLRGGIQVSWGFINTTDFASYITFLLLFLWCIQEKSDWAASGVMLALVAACTGAVYWITKSRTAVYCGILTVAAVLWDTISNNNRRLRKANCLTVFVFPLFFALFLVLLFACKQQAPWANGLDSVMSGRISLSLRAYEQYGMHPFGTMISHANGYGATMLGYGYTSGYGYLDIAYATLAIRYGWLISLAVVCLWVCMTIRALKQGEAKVALAMGIIAFHAFSEARFIDVHYNILFVMPFCSFLPSEAGKAAESLPGEKPQKARNARWFSVLSAVVIGCGVYWLLPTILSWLRTVFFLNGWTTGIRSAFAFMVSLGLTAAVIAIWKALNLLWDRRRLKGLALLVSTVALLSLAAVMGNGVIQKGLEERRERLEAEQEVISLIQASAAQPVYAAEASELYQRRFGGFTGQRFSAEELARSCQGSLLTDASVEVFALNIRGALYAKISPWSGIYAFDPQVIETLAENGYVWKPFNYSERSFDLRDLAIRNGLELDADGFLLLDGSRRSMLSNLEYDQLAGRYEVTYSLALRNDAPTEADEPVCTLVVMGEAGQNTILERLLSLSDFDENGKGSFTLQYAIQDTPLVAYLIQVRDGIRMTLEGLTWKKTE